MATAETGYNSEPGKEPSRDFSDTLFALGAELVLTDRGPVVRNTNMVSGEVTQNLASGPNPSMAQHFAKITNAPVSDERR